MVEASTAETLAFIVKIVNESLAETEHYRSDSSGESKYLQLANAEGAFHNQFPYALRSRCYTDEQAAAEANTAFRKLVTLHVRIMLLGDIFATAGYSQGRALTTLLQSVTGRGAGDILLGLGSVHRASIWENGSLKANLTLGSGDNNNRVHASDPASETPVSVSSEATTPGASTGVIAQNGSQAESSTTPTPKVGASGRASDPRETNIKALKHLASQLPNGLAPFFQCRALTLFQRQIMKLTGHLLAAVVRLFQTRRNPDAAQKQRILEAADVVADVALRHLSPRDTGAELPASLAPIRI